MSKYMNCGCASNAVHHGVHDGLEKEHPTCIIHGSCVEVAQPDLEGRTARCIYLGRTKPRRRYANDECNYICRGEVDCKCGAVESSTNLPFFKHKPGGDQDEFFCGCFGWD